MGEGKRAYLINDSEQVQSKDKKFETDSFSPGYPNIANWIHDGWIEIGRGEYNLLDSRANQGGSIWEGGACMYA
jgi:hypothetical protein